MRHVVSRSLAGSRLIPRRFRRFSTFALCRPLLPFAALWCTERARKRQRPGGRSPHRWHRWQDERRRQEKRERVGVVLVCTQHMRTLVGALEVENRLAVCRRPVTTETHRKCVTLNRFLAHLLPSTTVLVRCGAQRVKNDLLGYGQNAPGHPYCCLDLWAKTALRSVEGLNNGRVQKR